MQDKLMCEFLHTKSSAQCFLLAQCTPAKGLNLNNLSCHQKHLISIIYKNLFPYILHSSTGELQSNEHPQRGDGAAFDAALATPRQPRRSRRITAQHPLDRRTSKRLTPKSSPLCIPLPKQNSGAALQNKNNTITRQLLIIQAEGFVQRIGVQRF